MKYSEWILEQSISTADVDDIVLESCLAEMDVCCKILDLYSKRSMIMEYADPTSEIYQEAAAGSGDEDAANDSKEKVKEKWYIRLKDWFVTIWNKIVSLFNRNKYDKLLKIVKESDTQKYEWKGNWTEAVDFFAGGDGRYNSSSSVGSQVAKYNKSSILEMYASFGELLQNNDNDLEKWDILYRSLVNRIESREEHIAYWDKTVTGEHIITKDQMIGHLERLNKAQKTDLPEVNKLIRNIKHNNRAHNKTIDDKGLRKIEKEDEQAVINKINQIAKMLSNLYSKYSKGLMEIVESVVKDAQKTYKKETKDAKRAEKKAKKDAD